MRWETRRGKDWQCATRKVTYDAGWIPAGRRGSSGRGGDELALRTRLGFKKGRRDGPQLKGKGKGRKRKRFPEVACSGKPLGSNDVGRSTAAQMIATVTSLLDT
jgi:hypothetical protein